MSDLKLVNAIASAIQTADSSYFNENYTKQAVLNELFLFKCSPPAPFLGIDCSII